MREIVAGLLCIFVGYLSMFWAQEPKGLTEAEFEKELAIAEAFLKQAPTETKPVNRFIGVTAVTSVVENVGRMTDGAPLRLKAIALARKCAALPEYSIEEVPAVCPKSPRPSNAEPPPGLSKTGRKTRHSRRRNVPAAPAGLSNVAHPVPARPLSQPDGRSKLR